MNIEIYNTPSEIEQDVESFLNSDEIRNNVPCGILNRLQKDPDAYKEKTFFVVRNNNQKVVGYAHWTPPHPFCLAKQDERALDALISHVKNSKLNLNALHGLQPQVEYFYKNLPRIQNKDLIKDPEGCYQLKKVIPQKQTLDSIRPANMDDLDLITQWTISFERDCDLPSNPSEARPWAESRIKQQSIYLGIVNGNPVCCANIGREMPNGRSIAFVYTPRTHRKHGYASHLVADLSQKILDMGYKYTCLFTQLNNSTSNKIYQNIGYKWVDEFILYRF